MLPQAIRTLIRADQGSPPPYDISLTALLSRGFSSMERRAWVRFACDFDVTCRPAGSLSDAGWPGKVANVSASGVGLLLRHRFERGTELAVEIINRTGTFRRTLPARVMQVRAV